MGYFDQFDDYRPRKRRGAGATIFASLISSIVGGLVVFFLLPVLMNAGYLEEYLALLQQEPVDSTPVVQMEPKEQEPDVEETLSRVDAGNQGIVEAVARVENAVVGVINIGKQEDLFSWDSKRIEQGTGSGVIFEKKNGKARIVTNYHVIQGASQLEVSLRDGVRVSAKVVGADPLTDLAVIEIDAEGVETVASFGSSVDLKVGESAIAIGNPLGLKFSRTVTRGIISSIDRTVPVDQNKDGIPEWELDVLQTDAAINPGNSGGALINIHGEVIGINSLKISQAGVEGLGFAIPSDDVLPIIQDLVEYGEVQRPLIGIVPLDLFQVPRYQWKETFHLPSSVSQGVVVYRLVPSGPAEKAGLHRYDVIVGLDDRPIANSAQLRKYLYNHKNEGEAVKVAFYRGNEMKRADVVLGKVGEEE